jgi:integrase
MRGCRPLSDHEVDQVAAGFTGATACRDRALFLLGCKTGFRISELLSLRVADVHQAGRAVDRVTVERRHMKKKRQGRTVMLHAAAKAALETLVAELRAAGRAEAGSFLFQSREGGHRAMTRFRAWQLLKAAYLSCGLTGKLGTHSLRKTFADRVYDRLSKDLIRTQRALGHSNIASTISYLGFREEEIDEAILAI